MPKQLVTASIKAPGFYGLNLQDSSITLPEGFATVAENCVIDEKGRLGSRKGWYYVNETATYGTINLQGGHEFVHIDGDTECLLWCNSNFWIWDGVQDSTLTQMTNSSSNVFSTNNWMAATLNDTCFFFDRDYQPMQYAPDSATLTDNTDAPHGNIVLSAYGRLWVADTTTDKMTLYWSDLLDGTNFSTGTAGSLDLAAVLVNGGDRITALGAHAGRLIIFCENQVVIYGDTDGDSILDPVSMRLVEVISDVGCVVRDSVQNVGNDLFFLAEDGLHSLGRLIQEKGQPMTDLSKNIRDELVSEINSSDREKIRTVYSPREAFYVMLLPDFSETYVFDVREFLQDGSCRVTSWEDQSQSNMFMYQDRMYYTQTQGVGIYEGYLDNGATYTMKYYTNHMDFGDPTILKHMKRVSLTAIADYTQDVLFRTGFDYTEDYTDFVDSVVSAVSYGRSTFGERVYSTEGFNNTLRVPLGGTGSVFQIGIEAVINDNAFSIQRLDVYVKQGRIY